MSTTYSRRQALALGLGGLAGLSALGLAGCGGPSTSPSSSTQGGPVALQLIFWGSTTRDKLTRQAIDLFQKSHSGVTVTSQFTDFNTYWTKLNTMVAGNSTPDLIQMDMRYVSQYVRKGLLLDLTPFISKQTIDLSDFDPILLNGSKVNNTVYGVPLGGNYQAYLYDKDLAAKAGTGTIPQTMTRTEFAAFSTELSKALGNGVYGSSDNSGNILDFEVWIRQRGGKELYTHDGGIGFDQTDVADWFNYWSNLRQTGGCAPMNLQSSMDIKGTPVDSSVILKKAAFSPLWSNQLEAWQAATKSPLGFVMVPTADTPGEYLKASMLLSISAQTKHQAESAAFTNFLINDPDAVKALKIERGVPGSTKAKAALAPLLTPTQQSILSYMDQVSKSGVVRTKEVLDPPGAGPVADALLRTSQAIGFNKTSVSDGAKSFYADAQKALATS
ncbi:MAG TPA: extracellular solute-binding protein [Ktedonosporobacter sp.]|nr:extracellular solute-binding protein [Ktedonosporobacter sp.]